MASDILQYQIISFVWYFDMKYIDWTQLFFK